MGELRRDLHRQMRFFRQLRVPTAATYFWAFSQIALMAFVFLQRSTEVQSKSRDFRSVPDRYFRQICRPVVSAMIGFSILQSTPAIPQAHASDSLANIARASETVDFLLDNLENKDQDMKRLFDRVDFIIKQFSLRERLQLALAESPAEYR